MCGIIGYIGSEECSPLLLGGLSRLEYRGYDSAGVCIAHNQSLTCIKEVGRVADLRERLRNRELAGTQGIAHTRWATHGAPTEKNAHPHMNANGDIAIVHNGIIENFAELKELVEQEGYVLRSETDSEVLAHLIDRFYTGNLQDAVRATMACVTGTLGLVVLHARHFELIAVRRGSPLVLGIGKSGMFVASDVTALLEHTRSVVYLDDDELAMLTAQEHRIVKMNGDAIAKPVESIKWTLANVAKQGYAHFTLKEIYEQPESVANTLRGRIVHNSIKLSISDVDSISRIHIIGCGTSYHAGLIGKHLLESVTDIPVSVSYASEFRYSPPPMGSHDLVICISQSGETADTLGALRTAKEQGARTMGLVNVVGSSIARAVDSGIYLHAGPEIGVASTKAFTSQVAALSVFAFWIAYKRHGVVDATRVRELSRIPDVIARILETAPAIRTVAQAIAEARSCLFIGRGVNYPVALEGALKLKEVSYIHAEGYPAGELKHGPIALIDEHMPVVAILTRDAQFDKMMSALQEVKARGGTIIVVTDSPASVREIADYTLSIPQTIPLITPLASVIPLQLLAYYVADAKGFDVDKPRNLAKSVTVE